MMLRALRIAIVLAFALAAWSASEHKAPNAGLPLIHAAAPMSTCTPPTLDYSRRMVRLDGKSIA